MSLFVCKMLYSIFFVFSSISQVNIMYKCCGIYRLKGAPRNMNELSKRILEKYQVRKTKQQKAEFVELIKTEFKDKGVVVEESRKNRNIIVGNFEDAKYVFSAHYDTQPVLPFPNFLTPKNILFYLIYNILIYAIMCIPIFMISDLLSLIMHEGLLYDLLVPILNVVYWFSLLWFLMYGKANEHTANDNTSGVIALVEMLKDEEIGDNVCCIFFDNEELGLLGSAEFARKHKKELNDKTLINIDCIGDGDHIMLILSKSELKNSEAIERAFPSTGKKNVIITKSSNTIYPSDQANFKNHIGVAAFKKNRLLGYYLDKVHTAKDVNCDEENIRLVINGFKNII